MGCGTALVTPFRRDGSVDEPALQALVNWQIESGIRLSDSVRDHGRGFDADGGGVAAGRGD